MPDPALPSTGPGSAAPGHPLTPVIDRLAHLLPAQGPISIFIHHNTLHAFEHLRFEDAVERAGDELERQPFLAEARYREKLASGRILARDVEELLREQLGDRGASDVAGIVPRFDLWRAVVLHGIPAATGRSLSWALEETDVLSRFRTDLPADARASRALLSEADDRVGERGAVQRLWNACLDAVGRAGAPTPPPTTITSGSIVLITAARARAARERYRSTVCTAAESPLAARTMMCGTGSVEPERRV
jgi:hypothetical protein